jgi:hypothetical protein
VVYTPPLNGVGEDSFIVTANDGRGDAGPVTVRLNITAIKPSPPPPKPPGPPTPAQLLAGLKTDLGKDLKALKKKTVKAVRKARGTKMAFKWLKGGTVTVTWRGKALVARGSATRASAGAGAVRVKLTAAGRKLFKHKSVGKLKVAATFVSAGTKVTAKSTFKLRH